MSNAATRAPIYDSRYISREKISVALIFVLALGVRIGLRAWLEFDGLYGQDSFAYFDYAHSLADSITRATVPPPFFWPIGYPALTAFASFFIPIEIAAQWINILCGALIATFTFLLARELTNNHRVAFIAAIIVAGAGQLFISSLAIMADASALMWTMISAYALARFNRARSPKWIAGAGIALGLAMMTRWIYALMIPVWFVALWKNKNEFAASFKNCARLILFSLLALSPQIALMLYHAPNFPLAFIGDWARTGWDITHAWQNVIVNNDGNFSYALPVAAFYALPLAQPTYIFPFLTAFVLVGAWSLRRDQFAARILIGWIAAQWIYLSGDAWENWRFALAYFPPAAILAAMGVNYFFDSLPRAAPARFARLTLLLASLLLTFIFGARAAEEFAANQKTDRAVAQWARESLPPQATVITFGITETLKHFTSFQVVELYNETSASLLARAESAEKFFVLVNVENLREQWQDRAPQINFDALSRARSLRRVAAFGAYTLFAAE